MKKYQSLINIFPKLTKKNTFTYLLYLSIPFMVIVPLRITKVLQPLEWIALDTILRLRPIEKADPKIVIISIDEDDIKYLKDRKFNGKEGAIVSSISDEALAETIEKIASSKPVAIGVDIVRDRAIDPNNEKGFIRLQQVMSSHSNTIGIYKDQKPGIIDPIPNLAPEQLGFADSILDDDGRERRSLLVRDGLYSFAFQLSRLYLENQQIPIRKADDREIVLGNNKSIKSLIAPWGTYSQSNLTDNGGLQTIINYRNSREAFENIPLRNILQGGTHKNLRDRIVIIGYTSPAQKDYSYTDAISYRKSDKVNTPGIIYGAEYHAHVTSQFINDALSNRSNITPLNSGLDFLWLLGCSALIIFSPRFFSYKSSSSTLIYLAGYFSALVMLSFMTYVLILMGIWVSIVATIITFLAASPILTASYQTEKRMYELACERENTLEEEKNGILYGIEWTSSLIHETALQTLADLISSGKLSPEISKAVKLVDTQIRDVSDKLEDGQMDTKLMQSGIIQEQSVCKELQKTYEKFVKHIQRNQEEFNSSINFAISIVDFEGLENATLNVKNKTRLQIFLREALNNVRKHAPTTTRLKVIGGTDGSNYYLSISDNGQDPISDSRKGLGTQNSERLATHLHGKFDRRPIKPFGCECIITWPIDLR
jgi:CHASE2 domain-containing sensor protein/two-component sensor histidine kinase